MKRQSMFLIATSLVVAAGACQSKPDVMSYGSGDLQYALTERTGALVEMNALCGVSGPEDAAAPGYLLRRPYLQMPTDRSVQLLWTADQQMREATVELTTPDGTPVTQVPGAPDLSVPRVAKPGRRGWPSSSAVQWTAALTGLEPETVYCYQLSSGKNLLRRGGFRTAPAAGSTRPVRFAVVGDSGTGSFNQRSVIAQMGTVPFDLILHTGDIAYDSGTREQFEKTFFGMYADLLGFFPLIPVSGNHEYGTEGAAPFREVFALPENGGPGGRERWYSYDYGNVHFVGLDTEWIGPEQAAWLDADLSANRLPWTVVYLHRPPFSSGEHGDHPALKTHFVAIFAKHRVPLVLAGHDHNYERTLPMDGVTYVVTGGGGRETRPVGHSQYTAFAEAVCHFVYVTIEGDQLTLHAIDGVGREFDSLRLHRPQAQNPDPATR